LLPETPGIEGERVRVGAWVGGWQGYGCATGVD